MNVERGQLWRWYAAFPPAGWPSTHYDTVMVLNVSEDRVQIYDVFALRRTYVGLNSFVSLWVRLE